MPLAEDLGLDDVQHVLEAIFGLEGEANKNREYRIFCPIHEQEGQHTPSCDVNLDTGQWNCWACSQSGDIIRLGKLVLGIPSKKVRDLLAPNEPDAIAAAIQTRVKRRLNEVTSEKAKPSDSVSVELPKPSVYPKKPMKFLKKRGFTAETLKHWKIRFVPEQELVKTNGDTFVIRNNMGIPIFDHKGKKVLCWCYRATPDSAAWQEDAKYIYTPGLVDVLNRTWFGYHEARHEDHVAVVEGALDTMWCWQNGIPAVGMLGSSAKQFVKIEALTEFRSVTIMPDRDEAGMLSALALGDRLQEYGVPVKISLYRKWMTRRDGSPAGDPQDLCPLDLELFWWTAVPWQVWRSKPSVRHLADELARKTKGTSEATRTHRR